MRTLKQHIRDRIQLWYCNRGWSCKYCPIKCTPVSHPDIVEFWDEDEHW